MVARRRGVAAAGMLVVMLVVSTVVVAIVLGGARDQGLTVNRLETIRAFYAAEAGMNMAIRELMVNTDLDSDGAIGGISADGNDNNDPTIGAGRVHVTRVVSGQTTLTSQGRSGQARRTIQAVLQ
jgi:hypothetical protein